MSAARVALVFAAIVVLVSFAPPAIATTDTAGTNATALSVSTADEATVGNATSHASASVAFDFDGNRTIHTGEIRDIPLQVQNTDSARLRIGSDAVGYNVTATVTDGNDDGRVVLQFNSYLSGFWPLSGAYSTKADADSVSIETDSRPLGEPLDPAEYGLVLLDEYGHPDDQRVLDLRPRERGVEVSLWSAPEGTTFENYTDIVEGVGETVTPVADGVGTNEVLIHRVNVSDVAGLVAATDGDTGYQKLYNLTRHHQLVFGIQQTAANTPPNHDPKTLELEWSDRAISTFYSADDEELVVVSPVELLRFTRPGADGPVAAHPGEVYQTTVEVEERYLRRGDNDTATFTVDSPSEHATLNASLDDATLPSGYETRLSLDASSGEYSLDVTADDLDTETVESVFGASSFDIRAAKTTIPVDTDALAPGTYTFDLNVTDRAGSDTVTLIVTESTGRDITLDTDENQSVQRGQIHHIPIALTGTDTAKLRVGSAGVGYNVTATVTDGNDDGNVTLRFNSYLAGFFPASRAYGVTDPADNVTVTLHSDPNGVPIEPTDYEMSLVDTVSGETAAVDTLHVRYRDRGVSLDVLEAPPGTAVDNHSELLDTATPIDGPVGSDDLLVHRITVDDFAGVVEAVWRDTGNRGLQPLLEYHVLDFTMLETRDSSPPNTDRKRLNVSASSDAISTVYSAEHDQLLVVTNLSTAQFDRGNGELELVNDSDTYDVTVQITDPYVTWNSGSEPDSETVAIGSEPAETTLNTTLTTPSPLASGTVGTVRFDSTRGDYTVNIRAADGNQTRTRYAFRTTTLDIEGTNTTFPVDTTPLSAGTYTFEFDVTDAPASDNITLTVTDDEPQSIRLGLNVRPVVEHGETLVIPVFIENTGRARLQIGNDSAGYNVSAMLHDEDRNGLVTVQFDTSDAGTEPLGDAISVAGTGDEVVTTVRTEPRESAIDAGSYALRLVDPNLDRVITDASLRVDAPLRLPGADTPAGNVDDDALLEDVDGDGTANIFDALAYYNERDSEAIQANPEHFDFDGDGTAGTLFDALALYNEVS